MAPDERKGEQPVRDAAEDEDRRRRETAPPEEEVDPREEEGWSQPESSAQKTPPEP